MDKLTIIKTEIDLGVTALDGIPVVSSRYVAEVFGKEHKDVLRAIQNCGCSDEFNRRNFTPTSYKDKQGRKQPEVLLTKDGFAFIVMGFTGKKAAAFKEAYINRFNEMEQYLKNLNIARLEYPELTDAIKSMHDNPQFYHFSNEADMINSIVLGKRARDFRKEKGIPKGESIRPYLSARQLDVIQKLQKFDVGLVIAVPDFKERRVMLQRYFDTLVPKLLSGEIRQLAR